MQIFLSQIRPNVVLLALLAALFMLALSLLGIEVSSEVIAGYVGGLVVIAGRLLDPPPDPSIPVSALEAILRPRSE